MLSKEQYQVYQDRVEMSDSEYEMICVPTRDLRELLSLREQLAELKALPPTAYLIHEKGGARQLRFLGLDAVSQADIEEHELWQEPLFTAAKPAED
ncbi:TPA: hypothetical protein PXP49_001595 [Yersinia enterocolitica]|nr:hypothetical protein [Yersinia enterocolitica]